MSSFLQSCNITINICKWNTCHWTVHRVQCWLTLLFVRALNHKLLPEGQTTKNTVIFSWLMFLCSVIDLLALIRYLLCYWTLKCHLKLVLCFAVTPQPLLLMQNWVWSQACLLPHQDPNAKDLSILFDAESSHKNCSNAKRRKVEGLA